MSDLSSAIEAAVWSQPRRSPPRIVADWDDESSSPQPEIMKPLTRLQATARMTPRSLSRRRNEKRMGIAICHQYHNCTRRLTESTEIQREAGQCRQLYKELVSRRLRRSMMASQGEIYAIFASTPGTQSSSAPANASTPAEECWGCRYGVPNRGDVVRLEKGGWCCYVGTAGFVGDSWRQSRDQPYTLFALQSGLFFFQPWERRCPRATSGCFRPDTGRRRIHRLSSRPVESPR